MLLDFSLGEIEVAVGAFVASTLVTTGIVVWFLVKIRPDYFVADERGLSAKIASPLASAVYLAGKNLLGGVLVIIGILLSVPGVPGQGLLTILVGLLLLDVPGKRRWELRIVRRPAIRRNIDKLRARFDRPPLQFDEPDAAHHPDIDDS